MKATLAACLVFMFTNAVSIAVENGANDTLAVGYSLSMWALAVIATALILLPIVDRIFNDTIVFTCVTLWGIALAVEPRIIWNILPL